MNWMCTRPQVLQRKACHMLCVTCHMWQAVRVLRKYWWWQFLWYRPLSSGAAGPKPLQEQSQGKCFVQVSAERYSPHGPQHLQSNPGREQGTDSLSLLLHKHHQLVAQTLRLLKSSIWKTADMVRSKRQGVVKHWRWPSPPLGSSCSNRDDQEAALLLSLLQGG